MIDRNRIKFGYGDIAITPHPLTQRIEFREIYPQKIASKVIYKKSFKDKEGITFDISIDDFYELEKQLNKVNSKEIVEFEFKDYIFDFSMYNKESIEVVRTDLYKSMEDFIICFAC